MLHKTHPDSDFLNVIVPAGQRFIFLGYENGEAGGKTVFRFKDEGGNFGNISGGNGGTISEKQYLEINAIVDNKILMSGNSVPVFLQTNLGNFYPIEKNTMYVQDSILFIDVEPYLAYDNVSDFTPPWKVYVTNGYVPQRGIDYWTKEDIDNIIRVVKEYVDEKLSNG